MIRRPCSKCGSTDHPKYRRMKLRDNGNRTESMASYCVLCHAEAQKEREERRYEKKLAYNRAWRKTNRDKVNAYARAYYKVNKDAINEQARLDYVHIEKKQKKNPFWKTAHSAWHTIPFVFGKKKGETSENQPNPSFS